MKKEIKRINHEHSHRFFFIREYAKGKILVPLKDESLWSRR
jgi:hypothetical protein